MNKIIYTLLSLPLLAFSASIYGAGEDVPATPPDQGFGQTLIMISIALVFFYVILWRPEQKRRKAAEAQRSALKKGDRVTAMGIIGTIASISENTVILKMVDGSRVEFLKGAISDVAPEAGEEIKDKEEKS